MRKNLMFPKDSPIHKIDLIYGFGKVVPKNSEDKEIVKLVKKYIEDPIISGDAQDLLGNLDD